jgi:hypothetical protein
MTDASYVSYTKNIDSRFLNPFEKGDSKKQIFFGYRYGNAQFIFLVCSIISIILIQIKSQDFNKNLIMIMLILYYIFLYYNLSCYLVPDNHERCFVLAWSCIATIIFITIIILFHKDIFKTRQVGGNTYSGLFKGIKQYFVGGSNCNKKKKQYEGGNNYEHDLFKNIKKYFVGGTDCNKKEYQGGSKKENITIEAFLRNEED